MTRQKSDEFYYKQEEWYQNKKAKEQYFEKLYQKIVKYTQEIIKTFFLKY